MINAIFRSNNIIVASTHAPVSPENALVYISILCGVPEAFIKENYTLKKDNVCLQDGFAGTASFNAGKYAIIPKTEQIPPLSPSPKTQPTLFRSRSSSIEDLTTLSLEGNKSSVM